MDAFTQTDLPSNPKADKYRQLAGIKEITDDIFLKLDNIHSVIGYLLAKVKDLPEPASPDATPVDAGEQTDDDLDARDASGSVLPP